MKKRILASLLSAAMILGALSACSGSQSGQASQSPETNPPAGTGAPASGNPDPAAPSEAAPSAEPVKEAVISVKTGAVPGEDLYEMFVNFGEKLEAASGGAMTIDLYSSSDYRDAVALDDVLNNNADIVYLSSASASTTVSEIAYLGMYGCYNYVGGYDDTESFLSFYEATKDAVADIYADYNCHFLSYRIPGYLVIASADTEVVTPSDLSGKLMRTSGEWIGKLADSMNISTQNVKITEIATALQRKTVDAALSGDAQCRDLMFYEVSGNISIFPEADQVGCVVFCQSTWDKLDAAQQACVEQAAYDAMVDMLQGRAAEYEEMLELFKQYSDVRIITEDECAVWTSYIPAIFDKIDAQVGPKGPVLKDAILKWRADNGIALE